MLINLLLTVSGYGSKDYVLQKISVQPALLNDTWSVDFTSRLVLLPPVLLVLFFTQYSVVIKVLLGIWLLTGYFNKSFESRMTYDRNFLFSAVLDCSVYMILFLYVLIFRNATLIDLIVGQIALHVLRSGYWLFIYYNSFQFSLFRFEKKHFRNALLFFLPQVIGFVGGKADFYISMPLLNKTELGKYQLLIGFLVLFQGGLAAITAPYIKNIYRLRIVILWKLVFHFFVVSVLLFVLYLLTMYFILKYLYRVNFDDEIFLYSFMYGVPFLIYIFLYTRLFKEEAVFISVIHLCSFLITVLTGIFIIPLLGVKGSIISAALSQWIILGLIILRLSYFKKQSSL